MALPLDVPGFTDDEGDEALDEVELFRLLLDQTGGGPRHHCAADYATVQERFRDDLAALPHPLNARRASSRSPTATQRWSALRRASPTTT